MLRRGNTRPYHWADKTMSVLRADQLEACEKDLTGFPAVCLFDASCQDRDAEKLYDLSWYAEEDKASGNQPLLHRVSDLRSRVLSGFAPEMALLPGEEHDLLVRTVLFGGHLALQDWNDLIPARSLIRRLWCRGEWKDNVLVLHMPHQLCATALILLAGDEHRKLRDIVEHVIDGIDNTLYLMGMMQAAPALRHLQTLLAGTCAEGHPDLAERMLRAAFDYTYDREGQLVLLHPGLAEPDGMITKFSSFSRTSSYQSMTSDVMNTASASVMDLESPLYDRMLSVLDGAVRPEISPEDAVEDLIILAKQGVPYKDMKEVLSSMLVSYPTREMLASLENLSGQIPRWLYFSSSQVQ